MAFSLIAVCLTVFAGCLSTQEGDQDEPLEADASGVFRFDADGDVLPGPTAPGAPVYIDTRHSGAEPNMGITSTGSVFVSANSDIIRSQDRGENWEIVHTHAGVNGDPMLWVDVWTDHIYNAPMSVPLVCAQIYDSGDDGETWSAVGFPDCGRGVYDHQKIASGPPGPDAPAAAGVLHPTVLYACYNAVAASQCAVSYDNGRTWPHDGPISSQVYDGCSSGQVGHPTVSPDGIVVVGRSWGCDQPSIVYSTDSGLTWTLVPGPEGAGGETLDPEIAFTPGGTLYFFYQGSDHLPYLARTEDLGATWAGPWLVAPPHIGSTAFAALGAGDDGRVAMTFLGTDDTTELPSVAPEETRWHLWTVTSLDAANETPTFTAYQVTPEEDPVQIGCIWLGGGGAPCRNMLDFIDGAVAPDGTWFTSYTEGCAEGCAFEPEATDDDSRSRNVAVLRLDGVSLHS